MGKLNILLDAAILLLDEAAEYLDELDQLQTVTDEQVAKASILVAEAKVYANDAALQISEKLLELGGSRSSLSQHNLDQHWRNARVHTLHDPVRWKLHAIGNYYLNGHFPCPPCLDLRSNCHDFISIGSNQTNIGIWPSAHYSK